MEMNSTTQQKMITCRDAYGGTKNVPIESLMFRPSIYGVIVQDGAVLLSRALGKYDFPGGGINLGESMGDALAREIREETGLKAEIDKLLLVFNDFFIHPISNRASHTFLMYYTCKNIEGEVSTEWFDETDKQLEAEKAEWVPVERIDSVSFLNPIDSPALIRKVAERKNI